ncbi:hypothetical protein MANES_04G142000v8 [Manihot esculenta]|uniref:Uncharacterized protein n=1 Tax=Manihot esculenta TaxID=3983 RepID=A0ACB7HVB3_MANES|nr:hypothetical protein MANES_04G142000v8 [Manihot esculenta]
MGSQPSPLMEKRTAKAPSNGLRIILFMERNLLYAFLFMFNPKQCNWGKMWCLGKVAQQLRKNFSSSSFPIEDFVLEKEISFRESWKSEVSGRMSSDQNCEDDKFAFSFNTTSQGTSPNSHSERMLNRDSVSDISEISGPQSFRSTNTSCENLEFSATSESSKGSNSSQLANLLDTEMRKLKLEMQQSMVLLNSVTKEAVLAKHMIRELQQLRTSDVTKAEGEQITEGVEMEKKNNKVALLVQTAQRIAGIEAEKKAQHEAEKKRKTMETMANNAFRCRTYTIDDIEVATNHFELSQKIGEGGYGPVFKGVLNHIDVAIKILRPDLSQGHMQFRQEVDVLSSMRHPHIVILLGACPEYGCLVYEFMENGSLEDRLLRKHKTPPIPWRARFRIAFEIATALHFLHETKPEPLVHRDLKPANILLDYNLVSKISDVGLARLLPASAASKVSQYRMTAAAGTFYYIDPEYQQTGKLSVKSDIYSFGVVLLQLLTAKPPMGLFHHVQEAINNGTFADVLDKTITDWPVKQALSLAKIAVKCCELYKKHRPDLASVVLPELKRLRNFSLGKKAVEHETIIPLPSPTDLVS